MKNISFFILTFSICIISFNIFSQNNIEKGNPYIQNYNNEDYNTPENQTWAVIQDHRGVMYFGNNNGVLEFDGNRWRLIEIPNKSAVRSLTIDDNTGRIYVGAVGEIGYIETNTVGSLKYVSLLDKIPEEYRNFEDVWQIVVFNKQLIIQTTSFIFLLKENITKTLIPDNRFHTGFCVNNQFYVRKWGKGLFTLVNDKLEFIGQSGIFANERIYVMLPYENNKILIATRTQGIYIYSPNSLTYRFIKPKKFQAINNFLIKNPIYCGLQLDKKHFILGTFFGLIIIDKDGLIIQHIDKKSGLQDSDILYIYVDSHKNIWAGLNNGISYILINSPLTFYNEKNGLNGAAYIAQEYKGRLYAGTSLGLFYKDLRNNYTLIENTKGQSWHLAEIQGNLFLGHSDGVFIIKDNIAKNIAPNIGTVWTLNKLQNLSADRQDKPYILAGTNKGLSLLEYYKKNWILKHQIKGFDESSRYSQIENENNIWVSHPNKGVFKLRLNELLDSVVEMNFYDTKHGLPSNTHNYVFKIKPDNQNSQILFGTEKGIYKYDPQTNYFVPDEKFDTLLNYDGFIDEFVQDEKGNIFFQQGAGKGVLLLQNDGSYKLERTPFLKFKGLFIENISIIDSARILFCCRDGIIQYNPQIKPDYDAPYPVIIRQVLACDSLIFGGKENTVSIVKLPYKCNDLQFTFSSLYYEDHDKTQYSYYLEGFGPDKSGWSKWSLKTEKEYTNLHKGYYTFKVKAKNIYEKESSIAQYQFQILAPWYSTIVAYIFYGIIAFIFIWFVVKFYTRRLKKEKENLEKIVTERTIEILKQKEDIEEKNQELRKLSIAASKTSNAIIIFNKDGKIEWFNKAFQRIYGYNFDEFIKLKGDNIFNASSNQKIKEYTKYCCSKKESIVYETELETKDTKTIWIQTTLSPIINEDSKIEKLVAIDTDITELKNAETEIIQKSEEIIAQKDELEAHRNHLEKLVKVRTKDLELAKEKAEESDRLKSAFLANMSHEIRTPMNAIVGFSSLINEPNLSVKEKKEISYYINHNTDTLLKLIDDIIDLSIIESGQIKIDKRECNIDKIFSLLFEIFNEKRENLSKNKIEIKINNKLKKEDLIISTDPIRLQQILSNLIDNALKFTEKGFVEYGCFFSDKNNQELTFYVKDTGIGLSSDQQVQIFNQFNKIEEDKRKLYRGAGLGLSISKNLVELLGGKLWVESEKDKGSAFYFTLPFTKLAKNE